MNHKRRRPHSQRAGCKMCKFWKINYFPTEKLEGEKFSDHRRRYFKDLNLREFKLVIVTARLFKAFGF